MVYSVCYLSETHCRLKQIAWVVVFAQLHRFCVWSSCVLLETAFTRFRNFECKLRFCKTYNLNFVFLEENLYLFNNAGDHGGQVWTWGSLYAFNAQDYIEALGCIHLRFEFLSVIILHLILFSSSLSKFPNFLFDIFCPFAFPHLIVFEFFVHKWYS